jgi:hypothetical protein
LINDFKTLILKDKKGDVRRFTSASAKKKGHEAQASPKAAVLQAPQGA